VPQGHIGDGFAISGKFLIPKLSKISKNSVVHLCSGLNFCEDGDQKVDMLVNFLLRDIPKANKKIDNNEYFVDGSTCFAVATHQAYNAAITKIINMGKLDDAKKNLSLYIDEAHHIKSSDSGENESYNQLGRVLNQTLKMNEANKKINTRIGLTTATFFRGDQSIIVNNNYLDKFDRFDLEFIEHFETLGIDKVFVNFEEYSIDPIDQIVENIRREINERHLVVVPTIVGKWRKLSDPNLEKLINKIKKMLIEEGLNPDECMLNLVQEELQSKNKEILLREPKERYEEGQNDKIRIVITCMLGREGTDWCPCSRLHNASIELGSTTLAVQTLGRLFRKFENKNNVGITYYVKKFPEISDSTTIRDLLSDRINAMLSLMIIDDLLFPIMLPEIPMAGDKSANSKSKKNISHNVKLADVFGDKYEEVKKEILDLISQEAVFNEDVATRIIKNVLNKHGFKDDIIAVKTMKGIIKTSKESIISGLKVFLLRARSVVLREKNVDISEIRKNGFDLISENERGNFWYGKFTKKTFAEFKQLIGKLFWSAEHQKEIFQNIKNATGIKKIDRSNSEQKNIIQSIIKDLSCFHKAYNSIADKHACPEPDRTSVAADLGVSLEELDKKVKFLNKILPEGYRFWEDGSKICDKIAIITEEAA
jgi:hypothetical protein